MHLARLAVKSRVFGTGCPFNRVLILTAPIHTCTARTPSTDPHTRTGAPRPARPLATTKPLSRSRGTSQPLDTVASSAREKQQPDPHNKKGRTPITHGSHALHRVLQQPRRRRQDLHGLPDRLRDRQVTTRQEGPRPGLLALQRHHRAAPRRIRAGRLRRPDERPAGHRREHHRGHARRGAHPRPRARHGHRRARRSRGEEGRQHLRRILRQEEGCINRDSRPHRLPHPTRRSQRRHPIQPLPHPFRRVRLVDGYPVRRDRAFAAVDQER